MSPDLRYSILLLVLVVQCCWPVQAQSLNASPQPYQGLAPLCRRQPLVQGGPGLCLSAAGSGQVVADHDWPMDKAAWDDRLVPLGRVRVHRNPRRNRERWARRLARQRRRRPRQARHQRRRRQRATLEDLLGVPPVAACPSAPCRWATGASSPPPSGAVTPASQSAPAPWQEVQPPTPDPLADLRHSRGWIDQMDEEALWDLLRRIRWPHGVQCPHCGETDPRYLQVIDRHYRGGMWRHRCLVCARAGDPGDGGTPVCSTGQVSPT